MMRAIARCAFREPYQGGFVEALYVGQEVYVPDPLVLQLAQDGHIEKPPPGWVPKAPPAPAPPPAKVEAKPAEAPRKEPEPAKAEPKK